MRHPFQFIDKYKKITWTKTALVICMMPVFLFLVVFIIFVLCSVEKIGSVVSNSRVCAGIGSNILRIGGSAVDAAIATMMCEGVALPHSTGIGGGFTAIIRMTGRFDSIVATPTLPAAIESIKVFDSNYSVGAKAAGIPGELMGFWEMHRKYGLLSWKDIIEPSIQLCTEGVAITEWFAGVLRADSAILASEPSMSTIFPYSKKDHYEQDFKLKFPRLANTLRKISTHGVETFYGGEVGEAFVKDVQENDGIITLDDLRKYKVLWQKNLPRLRMLKKYSVVTTPLPTSGVIIVLILNIIKALNYENIGLFWHCVIEAMKHSFGMSLTLGDEINDPEYASIIRMTYKTMQSTDFARKIRDKIMNQTLDEYHYEYTDMDRFFQQGLANTCILAPNGDIVVATSSLNQKFGALFCSTETGIIVNNLVGQFLDKTTHRLKGLQTNRPIPEKHFVTSSSPLVVLDNLNRPYFIVGAIGGTRGVTLIVNTIIKYVFFKKNAFEAVNSATLHHQLFPNVVEIHGRLDNDTLFFLEKAGHKVVAGQFSYDNYGALTCIGCRNWKPNPQFDEKLGGSKISVQPAHALGIILVILFAFLCVSVFGLILYEVLISRKTI